MNPACGFPCLPKKDLDPTALKISFELLKYHTKSARRLTLEEYLAVRTNYWWNDHIHQGLLYVMEDGTLSILLQILDKDTNPHFICSLKSSDKDNVKISF